MKSAYAICIFMTKATMSRTDVNSLAVDPVDTSFLGLHGKAPV